MEKIKVEICMGTTCFVMGSSNLTAIEEMLPADLRARVEISYATCFNLCKAGQFGQAPFAKVNGEIIGSADIVKLMDKIRTVAGGVKS